MAASDDGFIAQLFVTNFLHGTVAANGAVVHRGTVVRPTLRTTFVSKPLVLEETTIGRASASAPTRRHSSSVRRARPSAETERCMSRIRSTRGLQRSPMRGSGPPAMGLVRQSATSAPSTSRSAGWSPRTGTSSRSMVGTATSSRPLLGTQVASTTLDGTGGGAGLLFGLAVRPDGHGIDFVDDGTNTLDLFHRGSRSSDARHWGSCDRTHVGCKMRNADRSSHLAELRLTASREKTRSAW